MGREYVDVRPRGWAELGHRFSPKVRRKSDPTAMRKGAAAAMPWQRGIRVLSRSVMRPHCSPFLFGSAPALADRVEKLYRGWTTIDVRSSRSAARRRQYVDLTLRKIRPSILAQISLCFRMLCWAGK